jgi:hypothetical protein
MKTHVVTACVGTIILGGLLLILSAPAGHADSWRACTLRGGIWVQINTLTGACHMPLTAPAIAQYV